jgi:hypothetical protein
MIELVRLDTGASFGDEHVPGELTSAHLALRIGSRRRSWSHPHLAIEGLTRSPRKRRANREHRLGIPLTCFFPESSDSVMALILGTCTLSFPGYY